MKFIFRILVAPIIILILASCAGPTSGPSLPGSDISSACDLRMLDHNRRACAERCGCVFIEPAPQEIGCGECQCQ